MNKTSKTGRKHTSTTFFPSSILATACRPPWPNANGRVVSYGNVKLSNAVQRSAGPINSMANKLPTCYLFFVSRLALGWAELSWGPACTCIWWKKETIPLLQHANKNGCLRKTKWHYYIYNNNNMCSFTKEKCYIFFQNTVLREKQKVRYE